MLQTIKVCIREDKPTRGKIGVKRYIMRKLHPFDYDSDYEGWIKYNHDRWAVSLDSSGVYHLRFWFKY